MNIDTVLQILDTRRAVARENGNTTELSLLYELTKIAEEYKVMKEVQIQRYGSSHHLHRSHAGLYIVGESCMTFLYFFWDFFTYNKEVRKMNKEKVVLTNA